MERKEPESRAAHTPCRAVAACLALAKASVSLHHHASRLAAPTCRAGASERRREPCEGGFTFPRPVPNASRKFLPGTPRICHPNIALFPRRFCAVFEGGICYSLLHKHLRSLPLKTAQFPASHAHHVSPTCRADVPRQLVRPTHDLRPATLGPLASPQNLTFSLQFPYQILKTHTTDRCRPTTYTKCPQKL